MDKLRLGCCGVRVGAGNDAAFSRSAPDITRCERGASSLARVLLSVTALPFEKRKATLNMNQYTLSATAMFAVCASFGATAMAQSDPSSAAAPDPVAPMPAATPAPNGPADQAAALPAEPAQSAFPAPTIPLANDERADVIKRTWPNRPMLLTGFVVLGGSYGASVIVAAVSDRKADDKLFLPVVGPWLDLKNRDCEVNDCGSDTLNKALLIGDGALQGIGALTMLLSLVIPESTKKPWYLVGDEKLSVAPQVGTNVTGLSASGRF